MGGPVSHILKEPGACTERERREFAHLVRQGFDGSDEGLPRRIHGAKCLAFHYPDTDTLAGISALKAPGGSHRDHVFKKADAEVDPAGYTLELGWVFVASSHRRNRIGTELCQLLLARIPRSGVFATTRPDNGSMIRILRTLGFERAGNPFPRRNEELVLFLRPSSTPDCL